MDIDMPIKDGYQTSREIIEFYNSKNLKKFLPIICISSAYVGEDDKRKAKK